MYGVEAIMVLAALMGIYLYLHNDFPWDGHGRLFYGWRKLRLDQIATLIVIILYIVLTVICIGMLFSGFSISLP